MGVGGARASGIAVWLLVILQTAACATGPVFEGGRYQHRRGRYSIAQPGGEDSGWQRIRVEGAELSFQGPGRAMMSFVEHCGRAPAKPRVLARQLLIGLDRPRLVEEGAVGADETEGWMQRLEATAGGEALQLKTVTRVVGQCSYDWILVSRRGLEGPEPAFDAWWKSFRSFEPEGDGEPEG